MSNPTIRVFGAEGKDLTGTRGVECALQGHVVRLASKLPLTSVVIRWDASHAAESLVLGDAWERSYGELAWKRVDPARIMPWYCVVDDPHVGCLGYGVKTNPHALCYWKVGTDFVELHLDVRSGNRPVHLGSRVLDVAEIVFLKSHFEEQPFDFVRRFCKTMSRGARKVKAPIYGINDWYYAYGQNNRQRLLETTAQCSEWAKGLKNRPFSVIDDGWQPNGGTKPGPWNDGNKNYGDMGDLAHAMRKAGCRPGIWVRPLHTNETLPEHWSLKKGALDPSRAEVLEHVRADIARLAHWGYELIKHDFTTWECAGQWGFAMTDSIVGHGPSFADDTRTSAEIFLALYQAIRDGAGHAYLMGCNAIGHLLVGTHELQRIGDDSGGGGWDRTRKMGINGLAFRAVQHDSFFEADADCVGITADMPWRQTHDWLKLVSRSGTPLFVSAQPDYIKQEHEDAIREAFHHAAVSQPLTQPLDWQESITPSDWRVMGNEETFDWSD